MQTITESKHRLYCFDIKLSHKTDLPEFGLAEIKAVKHLFGRGGLILSHITLFLFVFGTLILLSLLISVMRMGV